MDSNLECLTIQNISKLDINQDFAQKYLEYLLTLIQLNKPVDFIQAALVMQTLSSVFAKKVDHLQEQVLQFTVIFRKLELGRQAELEEGACSDNADPETRERDRAKAKRKNERDALLNRFEDICQDVTHIRKSCIKKFCADDVKKADSFLIRNKTYDCPRVKSKDDFSCYIYDSKEEILGRKEEFSINGMLCNAVVPKDDFCLSCNHGEDGASVDDSVFNIPLESHQMSMGVGGSDESAMDIEPMPMHDDTPPHSPGPGPGPDTHTYQNVVEEFLNNASLNESDASGFAYFEKMNKVGEAVMDLSQMLKAVWSPVSDQNKLIERKLKLRNTVKLPECLKKENEESIEKDYPDNYVLSDFLLGVFKSKSGIPFSRCFSKSFKDEEAYRKKFFLKGVKRRNKKRNCPAIETETEFRGFNEFGDEDDRDPGLFETENDVAPFDDVMLSPGGPLSQPSSSQGDQDYLQGAIQHIEDYQRGLHGHPDDTINEIAAKVSTWHDSIRPILEREEQRTCFDIHEYGSQILDKFPQNNGKNTLSFASIVQDQPREEIPRFFLSALLLANSYNVDIAKDGEDELAINDMNLTLLSRVRQHETLDQDMRKEYS